MKAEAGRALAEILERYLRGGTSAPVTLMQLLIETEDLDAARAAVLAMARDAAGRDGTASFGSRSRELVDLLESNADGCEAS